MCIFLFSSNLGQIDGTDLWQALSEDSSSNRTEILHNIDDIYGNAALTVGEWKIVKGIVNLLPVGKCVTKAATLKVRFNGKRSCEVRL